MKVIKYSGDIVDFDPRKLRKSLAKSGAGDLVVEDILHKISKEIYNGISTKKIYKRAFALLKKEANCDEACNGGDYCGTALLMLTTTMTRWLQ